MSTITAEQKDEIFRHPRAGTVHFGRRIEIVARDNACWAVVQMGEHKVTRTLLVHRAADGSSRCIPGPDGLVHQPCIALSDAGDIAVVWNEATDCGWEVRCAAIDTTASMWLPYEVIYRSSELCLSPTAAFDGTDLMVAWSGRANSRMRVHAMSRRGDGWQRAQMVSAADVDAFRPHLSADAGRAVLAWDAYRDQRYQVVVAQREDDMWSITATLGAPDERWLQPRTVVGPDGRAFVTWVVLRSVTDKLGIIDHWPLGMVGRIERDRVVVLSDVGHPEDSRIVADLRDGLLASRIYKGYVGLRRNPALSVNDAGDLWCVWESRGESEGSTVAGPLLARRLNSDDTWNAPRCVAETGYAYASPRRFTGSSLPLACMRFEQRGMNVIHLDDVDPNAGPSQHVDASRWSRWTVKPVCPEPKPTKIVADGDTSYRLFWADTHVHSIFSPDAEGELDELAHFARDQAGLDILTVIDNDYYPHKALTEPEWRIHQALADHFSEPGRFLWIPGYEFTYHRGDLTPDFNHRCVSYPAGHGSLHRRIDPDTDTDCKMIPTLAATGAMVYPHHCTYELIDNEVERNVEVTSSWRVCLEETDFTIQQLKLGHRLGFIGSSDTHRAVPGLGGARTGVLATELTRSAVREAYHERRLIATQGHNLYIDFCVNGATIGSKVAVEDSPLICVAIEAPKSIDYVELVRDGQVIHTLMPDALGCAFAHQDLLVTSEDHFYFLRIKLVGDPSFNRESYDAATNDPKPFSQDSRYPHNLARARGPFAWTSPIWITRLQGKTKP